MKKIIFLLAFFSALTAFSQRNKPISIEDENEGDDISVVDEKGSRNLFVELGALSKGTENDGFFDGSDSLAFEHYVQARVYYRNFFVEAAAMPVPVFYQQSLDGPLQTSCQYSKKELSLGYQPGFSRFRLSVQLGGGHMFVKRTADFDREGQQINILSQRNFFYATGAVGMDVLLRYVTVGASVGGAYARVSDVLSLGPSATYKDFFARSLALRIAGRF